MGKGLRASMLSPSISLFPTFQCSPTWKLSKTHLFGFLERLHYTGMIDLVTGYWQSIQIPAPLPTTQNHLTNINSSVHERSLLLLSKHLYHSYCLRNSKGFRSSVLDMGRKTKYIFLITSCVWKKSSHCKYNENSLHNINVTWQPWRVDFNEYA